MKGDGPLAAVGERARETASDEAIPESRRAAALELIEGHDRVFRRTARRYSLCADDAEDAYQRSLEILLTKAPPIRGDSLIRWMQTVTKRESLAVRRQRERLLNGAPRSDDEDRDPLDSVQSDAPGPVDRAAGRERVARSKEALRALKPQEVRALILKAEGYSYAEIGEITGWSYTKINRCMAEGRKRFLEVFAEIEKGGRCERYLSALSAVADGELETDGSSDVEIHLRSCAGCRAKLRSFRAVPNRVLELMPVGPALDPSLGGRAHEWVIDRTSAASDRLRELGYSLMNRSPDGAGEVGTQLVTAGGTRGTGMAAVGKLLAICGATAAGGAACVVTGVVNPVAVGEGDLEQPPPIEQPAERTLPSPPADTTPVAEPPDPPAAEMPAEPPAPPAPQQEFGVEQASDASSGASSPSPAFTPSGGGGSSGGGGARGEFGF